MDKSERIDINECLVYSAAFKEVLTSCKTNNTFTKYVFIDFTYITSNNFYFAVC